MSERPVLVVFSDDWGRHPSSCQHLVRELLLNYEVIWIDTIGTRPVRFDLYTVRRGFGKLSQWLKPSPAAPITKEASPKILKPVMWPGFGSRFARGLNCRAMSRCIRNELKGREAVFLTTIPVVADLAGAIPAKRWVYYCVDDFSVWPGLDGSTLRKMEAELVSKVQRLVVVSKSLQKRILDMGRESTLLTHGVDVDFWSKSSGSPQCLAGVETPIALFWGLVDARLNVDWIAKLSESLDRGTIVLVGPSQNPDQRLSNLKRVQQTGPVDFSELPAMAAAVDALIMPYADLPVTRAMQPLKFKEYLATGKPVVATRLPATEQWNDAADLVDDADGFATAVQRRIKDGVDPSQLAARDRLTIESWSAKARELEKLLFEDSP